MNDGAANSRGYTEVKEVAYGDSNWDGDGGGSGVTAKVKVAANDKSNGDKGGGRDGGSSEGEGGASWWR